MNYAAHIAEQLNLGQRQVEKTIELLEQGATVPFIARYRKEATGSLNEVQIAAIRDMLAKLKELDKRREAILASINEQGKLTPELKKQIQAATTMTELTQDGRIAEIAQMLSGSDITEAAIQNAKELLRI